MRKAIGVSLTLALGLSMLGAAAAQESDPKKEKEPFYRRYLIPGNPLDEKIREQEKLVLANPKSAALRNDFGNLLALRRFPKQAREQYEIAMKLDKNSYLAAYNMGIVFETEGKTSRAVRAYEKAVDRNRGFPPGLFRLGRLYEKRGWEGRAIEMYAKALRIDPGMRDPRHNPFVVDTRLLDRVSLANYERDLAAASIAFDARYADEGRFRRLPYDRTIYSEEVEPASAAPPAPAGAPPPAVAPRAPEPIPAAPGQTRPQAIVPAPASAVPPAPPAPRPTPYIPIINPAPLPTPEGDSLMNGD
jgi:tetratricopeptide (TPR) repeat protein